MSQRRTNLNLKKYPNLLSSAKILSKGKAWIYLIPFQLFAAHLSKKVL